MSTPNRTRGKRRFTADEARAALLAAGVELLGDVGLASGLDRVTFGAAVERSGVPRPSAYRLFSDGEFEPQAQFRMALLLHLLMGSADRIDAESGLAEGSDEANALVEHMFSGDGVRMAYALREAMRLGTNERWTSTPIEEAAVLVSAVSIVVDPNPHPPLVEAYQSRRAAAVEQNVKFYRDRLQWFGLRMKSGFRLEDLASLMALSLEQIWEGRLAHGVEPNFMRPTGLDGELLAWTPFGITCEGLILTMVESDPEAEHSADLTSWLTA